jgi:hypothetical protein
MRRALLVTVAWLVLVPAGLVGCANVGGPNPTYDDPAIRAAARITIQYATLKLIGDSEGRAERVIALVDTGLALAEADLSSVEELRTKILALIPPDALEPPERLLVANLSELIVIELKRRVDVPGTIPILEIREVLGWVREAAVLAGPA